MSPRKGESREAYLLRRRACHAANRQRENARRAATRAANRDRDRATVAAWRARNREHIAEYKSANRDRISEYNAEYNSRNPLIWDAGERYRANRLPDELRPIALLIKETRREIKKRSAGA